MSAHLRCCIDSREKGRLAGGTLGNSLNAQAGIGRDTPAAIWKFHVLATEEAKDFATETGQRVGSLVARTNANSVDENENNLGHSCKRTFLLERS